MERELKTLNDRLAVLEPDDDVADDGLSEHVLTEIRQRLTGDLSDSERREIVQLLVRRITVHTTLTGRGPKQVRVVIDYRFPPGGAAHTRTHSPVATSSYAFDLPIPTSSAASETRSSNRSIDSQTLLCCILERVRLHAIGPSPDTFLLSV